MGFMLTRSLLIGCLLLAAVELAAAQSAPRAAILTSHDVQIYSTENWKRLGSLETSSRTAAGSLTPSQRLARKGRDHLVVLAARELVLVRLDSLAVLRRQDLPAGEFTSVSVHPTNASIAVCGTDGFDAVVLLMESSDQPREAARVPGDTTHDWVVYQCTWAEDGSKLFVSYHGMRTTGVDWFVYEAGDLTRCEQRSDRNVGCLAGHGAVFTRGDALYVATGSAEVHRTDAAGDRTILNTGLQTHLMEFALAPDASELYAIEPCGYGVGFGRTRTDDPGKPIRSTSWICSDRLKWIAGSLVSMASGAYHIDVVDPLNGRAMRRLQLGASVLDVLELGER